MTDLELKKRREFEEAINDGLVADPVTTAIFGVTAFKFLAGVGVSVGLSIGSALLTRALAPKPKPIEKGRLTGDLLMDSSQGLFIPEVYGADPGDGKGGVRVPAIIIGTSGIRKTPVVSRQPVGGGK